MSTAKHTIGIDEQIDIMIKRVDSYKKIRDFLKTLPDYDKLVITSGGSVPKNNTAVKLTFRYNIPYTLKDSKWAYGWNNHSKLVPDDYISKKLIKAVTAIDFNVTHDIVKDKLKFKIRWIGDGSKFKDSFFRYNNEYTYPAHEQSVIGEMNKLFGWDKSAMDRTSVKRLTDDANFFKTAIVSIIDAIKADDLGKAKIAAHNLATGKAISVLK